MTLEIISQVILLGIALAMDAFAVSITDGLIYTDLTKKKSFFIAGLFGLMQGIMPLIGYFLIELIALIVGSAAGAQAQSIMAVTVTWIAFALLIFLGGKMLIEAIIDFRKKEKEAKQKLFSYKEVFLFSIATSIDALGSGVALHSGLSNNATVFLHVSIIVVITFVICLLGVFLGNRIEKVLKGRTEITSIIGGVILILLAVWIILSHYVF